MLDVAVALACHHIEVLFHVCDAHQKLSRFS